MRPGHGKNVRGTIDQRRRQRLAAKMADVHALVFANLHGIQTRGLATDRMHAGLGDLDVFTISQQTAKQPLRDGTAANVSGTDKKDAFHNLRGARARAFAT